MHTTVLLVVLAASPTTGAALSAVDSTIVRPHDLGSLPEATARRLRYRRARGLRQQRRRISSRAWAQLAGAGTQNVSTDPNREAEQRVLQQKVKLPA
jgi:hypothetical protein